MMSSNDWFPLEDGGVPKFAQRCGLGERFQYWRGRSGRRYLFTAVGANDLADFSQAVIVLARADGARLCGAAIVCPDDPGEPTIDNVAHLLARDGRLVVYVHLLADDTGARRRLTADLLRCERLAAA